MGAEGGKRERMTEYIRRDPIRECSPLPVFASDQIGGWFVVDSPEYIPRSLSTLCEKRSQRGVTNGSALKTPQPLFRVSPSLRGFFGYVFASRDTLVTNVSRRCLRIKNSWRCCDSASWSIATHLTERTRNQAVDISVQFNSWTFETVLLTPMKNSFISF